MTTKNITAFYVPSATSPSMPVPKTNVIKKELGTIFVGDFSIIWLDPRWSIRNKDGQEISTRRECREAIRAATRFAKGAPFETKAA